MFVSQLFHRDSRILKLLIINNMHICWMWEIQTNRVNTHKILCVRNNFCTQRTEYEIKIISLCRVDYLYQRVSAISQTKLPLQFFQNSAIGIVYLVGLYGSEIDAGRFFVVVTHPLADDAQRYIF